MLAEEISNWLKLKVKSANAKGIVFGLSGGVDSAVVGVLSKKALKDKVLSLILPCYSYSQDVKDAKLFAKKFNIKTKTIILDSIYDNLLKILPPDDKLACANLKPRLRMITLYYFANKFNYLVAGTGNRSEITIGYFTKYGDGGADILPLGGLLKTQVWKLAKELKVQDFIINKPPSAGLWKGQTDEEEIGISYKDLDKAIIAIETGKYRSVDKSIINKVKKLILSSAHKKKPPPYFEP